MCVWKTPVSRDPPTLTGLKSVQVLLCAALVAVGTGSLSTTVAAAPIAPRIAPSAGALTSETTAYESVAPLRLADTRTSSPSGFQRIDATTVRVTVDATAKAAALTVTVVDTTAAGYVTVWPTGTPRPNVSNINVAGAGETRANSAVVRLGTDGAVDVYVDAKADVLVDLVGLFRAASHATAGRYVALPASRIFDTRQAAFGASSARANQTRLVPLPAGVPPDATAMAVNLTFADTAAAGFFSAWPAGSSRPQASTGNADGPRQTRAIFAVVPVSAGGFQIYTQSGAHVIVDEVGYFTGSSADDTSDGLFVPQDPQRLLDTRTNTPGLIWPGGTIEVPGLDADHAAVWMNYTTIDAFAPGYLTAYPARTSLPLVSTLNTPGTKATVANAAITNLSSIGVALTSFAGEHALADLAGYFTGSPLSGRAPVALNEAPATFVFGRSAGGRPLVGHHRRSSATANRTVLVVGSMHGEEPAGGRVVDALGIATLPTDLDLWMIDTVNPDGIAGGSRQNNHGVDLNRNWPGALYPYETTGGYYSSGPYPMSEPENQATLELVQAINATGTLDWAVSYHQPLDTVDCDPKRPTLTATCASFAKGTGITQRPFIRVPGSMTDTMMAKGLGRWFTVEFGTAQPTAADVARHVAAISVVGRD
jgi:Zinc carboxypeptidase